MKILRYVNRILLKRSSQSQRDNLIQVRLTRMMATAEVGSNMDVSDSLTNPDCIVEREEGICTKFNIVSEGKAKILQPTTVFYNRVQEFNRDITIAFISEFAEEHARETREKKRKKLLKEREKNGDTVEDIDGTPDSVEDEVLEAGVFYPDGVTILEGLAASGLRSMRFAHEIPGVHKIICNDFDAQAVEVIEKNIKRNKVEHLVVPSHGDASMIMYQNKGYKDRFDVVDLDPYGTAAPFLDAAVQAVRDGGLLCVTCTDAAVLCGNTPEKCYALYGSASVKGSFCHEMGIRIILRCIESHAARHSRYIVPLASLSVDFYFRVFVKVYSGAYKTKFASNNSGMVYHCSGCGMYETHPMCDTIPTKNDNVRFILHKGPPVSERCEHCNSRHQVGGPAYLGKIHDKDYCERIIARVNANPEKFGTAKRIEGMLSMASEELDVPLYHELDALNMVIHAHPPKMNDIRSAILNAGYKVSYSHACKNSIKTNAPNNVIWDIMRAHVERLNYHSKKNTEGTPGHHILQKKPTTPVNFDPHPDTDPLSKKQRLSRFPGAPAANWGPLPRAKRGNDGESLEERRLKNQGKRKKKEATETEDGLEKEAGGEIDQQTVQ